LNVPDPDAFFSQAPQDAAMGYPRPGPSAPPPVLASVTRLLGLLFYW
jgi:hypothetical protein